MWTQNAFTRRLQLRLPIIQGPFGGGLSSVALAAAVAEAGGLGSFGVHHLDGAGILATATALRAATRRPFALNLWLPHAGSEEPAVSEAEYAGHAARMQPHYQALGLAVPPRPARYTPPFAEQMEAVLEARPAAFSFIFGVPEPAILAECRARDIVTIGTATTVAEARRLDEAGVDCIVATGFEAGGHRPSFLRSAEDSLTGSLALVPQVVDAVSVPVIAAGGIADGRGIAAALSLGALGVQMGTAFLACRESGTSEAHRNALFTPTAADTRLSKAFSGRLARFIRTPYLDTMAGQEAALPPYPVQGWLAAPLKQAATAQGRPDYLALYASQTAGLLRHREAARLMASLEEEVSGILARD